MPLALTDQQLDLVRTAAHQLPRSLRSAFLQRLAAQLGGREFGDGQLHRVAHAIVRELLAPPSKLAQTGGEVLRGFNV
jgi:hypothetical protein